VLRSCVFSPTGLNIAAQGKAKRRPGKAKRRPGYTTHCRNEKLRKRIVKNSQTGLCRTVEGLAPVYRTCLPPFDSHFISLSILWLTYIHIRPIDFAFLFLDCGKNFQRSRQISVPYDDGNVTGRLRTKSSRELTGRSSLYSTLRQRR